MENKNFYEKVDVRGKKMMTTKFYVYDVVHVEFKDDGKVFDFQVDVRLKNYQDIIYDHFIRNGLNRCWFFDVIKNIKKFKKN